MSTSAVSPDESFQKPGSMFYVVSVRKLVIMMIGTFGFYFLYWNYRNWATYKRASGERVIPFLRAFFAIFFLYPLLRRVDRGFQTIGREYRWWPGLLTLGYLFAVVIYIAPEFVVPVRTWLGARPLENAADLLLMMWVFPLSLFAVQIWLVGLMQRAINTHECDPAGLGNAQLTFANGMWMVPGILLWTLNVLGLFALLWLN